MLHDDLGVGGSREAPHQRRKGEGEAALSAGEHGRGSSAARALEPAAVLLASDILRWVLPGVAKFPKTFRYGLGARIEGALLDVMEALVSAQYARAELRGDDLRMANRRLQVARHLNRVAVELGLWSQRQGLHLAGMLLELGKQVGAWSKASEGTASSSRGSAIRKS